MRAQLVPSRKKGRVALPVHGKHGVDVSSGTVRILHPNHQFEQTRSREPTAGLRDRTQEGFSRYERGWPT